MKKLTLDYPTVVNLIERTPVFHGLTSEDVSKIASCVIPRAFEEGDILGDFDDVVDEFWIITDGSVDTFFNDRQGKIKLLSPAGPGDHLGEVALIEKSPRPIRIVAQTAGSLLAIPADDFASFMESHPLLMRNLYRTLSHRFKKAVGVRNRDIASRRLGIVAQSRQARLLVARLVGRLTTQGEEIQVISEDAIGIRNQLAWPDQIAPTELPSSFVSPEAFSDTLDRHIVVLSRHSTADVDFRRFHGCEEVLWMLEPKDAAQVVPCLQRALYEDASLKSKLRLVWLLSNQQPVAPWLAEVELERTPIKVHVFDDKLSLNRLEKQGLDRLLRAIQGYKIGIALAGGGAKGMAHLGVLRAFDDAGISFDAMSGASAGAMAGIIYASGIEPLQAAEYFQNDLTPSRAFRRLPGWPNLYLLTQFRRQAWESMLRVYLHDWRLEQLPIDFMSLTVDLVQSRSVVRKTGDAVHAILESINLPVISRPILRDGMVLVDGGMLDNLPADVLASNACEIIVGVDVSRRMNPEFAGNRSDTPTRLMKRPSALSTLMRIFESQAHNLGAFRSRAIDFWITPDTSSFALADFYRSQEIADIGVEAANKMLPEIRQRLADFEKRLFKRRKVRDAS